MSSRLHISQNAIFEVLDRETSRVFRRRDLDALLLRHRRVWRLPEDLGFNKFAEFLTEKGRLRQIEFPFPNRKEIRYAWGEVSLLAVLMSLKPNCHFSHYTAMRIHELTEQDPKTVYVNFEQQAKSEPTGELAQDRIDAAFARRPRMTSNIARIGNLRIFLLNGKNTGYAGVETRETSIGETGKSAVVRVTNVERTLVDIAVRPFYAGGVAEVLKAYRRAAPRVSVDHLGKRLEELEYIYPYHQAIGYYLDRSGAYAPAAIARFRRKFKRKFYFYLTYEMRDTRRDERWKLVVPEGL